MFLISHRWTFIYVWSMLVTVKYFICDIVPFSRMTIPFERNYFSWAQPLIVSEWGIVTVAIPPDNDIPFVTGNMESAIYTLKLLVEGFDHPNPDMLPVRFIMPPAHFNSGYELFVKITSTVSTEAPHLIRSKT